MDEDVPHGKKVNDLVSRFEGLKNGDHLQKHIKDLEEIQKKYRAKHAVVMGKQEEEDRLLAQRLQEEENDRVEDESDEENDSSGEDERVRRMKELTEELRRQEKKLEELLLERSNSLPTWQTEIFAGKFQAKGFVDGVLSREALFSYPTVLTLNRKNGAILVSDSGNNCIRKITDGIVSVVAGSGIAGDLDGEAWQARFNVPKGLDLNNDGDIFVADQLNNKVRIVFCLDGTVGTVAGDGRRGHRDGPAESAYFNHPEDVAVGLSGEIFVADTMNHVIRRIDSSGIVTTITGRPGVEGCCDGLLEEARFCRPHSIAVHPATGCLLVGEASNRAESCIRCIDIATQTVISIPDSEGLGHCSISIGPQNDIILSDAARNQVFAIDDRGEIHLIIECPHDGMFREPSITSIFSTVQADQRTMYLVDTESHCVFRVQMKGDSVKSHKSSSNALRDLQNPFDDASFQSQSLISSPGNDDSKASWVHFDED